MDFATLPPEVNSARMYAGPGPGPMLAAASAWDGLAAELQSTAASYRAAISELTGGPWLGSSSASMAAAATPYLDWMTTTAGQAEQTATQARSAAAAYEAAFAMTVPPAVIAANRSLLMTLIATNVLGQNTAAIAATEDALRRDVGPRRHGDVRLRRLGGGGIDADAVRRAPADNQPGRRSAAGRSGGAVDRVERLAGDQRDPPGVTGTRDVRGGNSSGPGV